MDESFDPTYQETLNPYAAPPPQSGGGFLDMLTQALSSGAGMAQDIWNYQPFQSQAQGPQSLNAYQPPTPGPAPEQPRDPFMDMLYPSLVKAGNPYAHFMVDPLSEQAATGHTPPPLSGMDRAKAVADLVGQATPFEGAAVGVPGVLRALTSADPNVGAGAVGGMLGLTPGGKVRVPKIPPLTDELGELTDLFTFGKLLGGNKWYHNFSDTITRAHGDEARIYAGVVAALSPLRPAGALTKKGYALHQAGELTDEIPDFAIHMGSNLVVADKVWDAFKKGGVEEVERVLGSMTRTTRTGREVPSELAKTLKRTGETGIGVMDSVRDNVLSVLKGGDLGGDDAQKIRAFREALMGDKDAIVLDTWMKRVFYPEAVGKGRFSPAQYEATEEIIKKFAEAHQSTPADVQAALWVAQKYLDEGADLAALGSMPFVKSLEYTRRYFGKDLSAFGPNTAKTLALAGVILGSGMLMGSGEAEAAVQPSMPEAETAYRPYTGRPMLTQ